MRDVLKVALLAIFMPATAVSQSGDLRIHVVEYTGGVVVGATVSIVGGPSQTTSSSNAGVVVFTLAPGIYNAQVTAANYNPIVFTATVVSGATTLSLAPLIPRSAGMVTTVTVPARQQNFDSGVEVNAGQIVIITAVGQWGYGPVAPGYPLGPDGIPGCRGGSGWVLPNDNCGALASRIGSGEWFHVGPSFMGRVLAPGRLFFSINDLPDLGGSNFADNIGELQVTITRVSPVVTGAQLTVNQVDTSQCPNITLVNSVTDSSGQAMRGLGTNAFTLNEDGQPRSITVNQSNPGSSVLSIALLIDVSGSQQSTGLSDQVTAARVFLTLLGAQDRIALFSFAGPVNVHEVVTFTADRGALNRGLDSLRVLENTGTAMHDAIVLAARRIGAERTARRAIVLMTDGWDNRSTNTEAAAIASVRAAGVPVFAIGYPATFGDTGVNASVLRRIADGTGGLYYDSGTTANLQNILTAVGGVITSQYLVTYTTVDPTVSHQVAMSVNYSGQMTTRQTTVSACQSGGGSVPAFTASSVTNAASFVSGMSSGSLVSVFGRGFTVSGGVAAADRIPLPTQLNGTSVMINGIPAPLLFVSDTQINLQVPHELTGQSNATLVVSNGIASTSVQMQIMPAHPGIFTVDGTSGAILHGVSNQLVSRSNPASRGEVVVIYATGLGPVNPLPQSGAAAPSSPLSVTALAPVVIIGGIPGQVLFSGLAPGYVGLYQLNVAVPVNAPTGDSVEVLIQRPSLSRAATVAIR